MNKENRPARGIDWASIFRKHPELKPPGYEETVAKIKAEKARP
jgi:hypothetical protein